MNANKLGQVRSVWPRGAGISRRRFLEIGGSLGLLAGLEGLAPAYARRPLGAADPPADAPLSKRFGHRVEVDLEISETGLAIDGRNTTATTINGTVPGPLLRFREGDDVVIRVTNALAEDTSIHWHGILLPNEMDGVPKVNFPGIPPGETFTYRYPVAQYGTYWYHSHSGLQEQLGHYGPLIIDPAEPEPFQYDRDYVVVLGDWTFEDPYDVLANLKKMPGYYNFQRRTLGDFFQAAGEHGVGEALSDRLAWGRMRMESTDISDVTGVTYTYLMNGLSPASNWTGVFTPGERVRLRFINAAAASMFDVHVPGLPMEVVQVSGQHVQPVTVDEFRIGIAETFDVVVRPDDRPYTVFAESMDRSGYARGTIAPRPGMSAPVPDRRPRPLLTMADMGMMHDMSEGGGDMGDMPGMDHGPTGDPMPMAAPDSVVAAAGHEGHMMGEAMAPDGTLAPPGMVPASVAHGPDHHGKANAAVPMMTTSRLHEPGLGLGEDGRRVLVYTDLRAIEPNHDLRPPTREIELHLTGNMERFMWSIDGKKFSEAEPIHVDYMERIRLTIVNDTMMHHPMHLHGMWMELENGAGHEIPRVHTVNVKPAERVSLLVTADAQGPWAFHCHVLYHMEAGMFRVFHVGEDMAHHDAPES